METLRRKSARGEADSSLGRGVLVCYDSVSWNEDFRFVGNGSFDNVLSADVDGDGLAELLFTGRTQNAEPAVYAVDLQTGFLDWRSPPITPGTHHSAFFVESADLDGDHLEEILVGTTDGRFAILDGATGLLEAGPADLDAASVLPIDLGADGLPEIVVGTMSGKVVVVDPASLIATDLAVLSSVPVNALENGSVQEPRLRGGGD